MQFDWRAISGPALTTATALIAIFVDRHVVAVPNPAALLVCIVAFAAAVSGLTSGLITAAIAVAASALFFLNHRAAPGHAPASPAPADAARDYCRRCRWLPPQAPNPANLCLASPALFKLLRR